LNLVITILKICKKTVSPANWINVASDFDSAQIFLGKVVKPKHKGSSLSRFWFCPNLLR